MESEDGLWLRPQIDLAAQAEIPRRRLGAQSVDPRTAAQLVRDELLLDGNSRLNLATFVSTWM
jgi:glutamate decarboxylase